MPVASISDILKGKFSEGDSVTVQGWVRTRRDSKGGFSFLQLNDGSCFASLQAVLPGELENYQAEVLKITAGCSVTVTGKVKPSPAKGQAWELDADGVKVLGWVEDPDSYPIQPKKHSFEFLRTVAHLRPRTNTFGAVARVRHALSMAVHRFFHQEGFYWVHTPIITASDCEGAGDLFRVVHEGHAENGAAKAEREAAEFFGRPAYLTVSGQLNLETYCQALSKVYTFAPTFRAENSNTPRHLAEFWMIEPEIAFASLKDNADLAEAFLKSIFKDLLETRADDLAFFAQRVDKDCLSRLEGLVSSEFVRMEYSEAISVLEKAKKKFEFPVHWGVDLQTEHERYLTEEHVGRPVIVLNYPKEIKAFYMRLNDDEKTVAAMDVLAPGIGEIIGGSQREERLEVLDRRIGEMGLNKEDYGWYRDLRRYGTVPHAGFGLGFERTVVYATGLQNIRDAIPFPRVPGNAAF